MSKNKPTTPQEIFDYKQKWIPRSHIVVIEQYDDVFAKDWCRKNLDRHQWSFEKYANPDDSHVLLFESINSKNNFQEDYNLYMAKY